MIFQNLSIDPEQLPQVESVEMYRPHRNYLKVVLLSTIIFMLILLIGVIAAILVADEPPFPYFNATLIGVWSVLAIYFIWLSWKGYKNQAYALREKDVIYKRGVLVQKLTTVPFNRVQHCEIKQGPIERYFGLKTLEIYTAGGSGSDLLIPGLSGEKAQQLKDFIIKTTAIDGRDEEE